MFERISEDTIEKVSTTPAVSVPQPAPAVPQPAKIEPQPAVIEQSIKGRPGRKPGSGSAQAKTAQQGGEDVGNLLTELREELNAVRELKEELKQKVDRADQQYRRVDEKVFGVNGATESDIVRHQSKAQRMKAYIWAQPKKTIYIPVEAGEERGKATQPVTMNGYRLNVPKGVSIEVPAPIADKIMRRLQQTDEALDNKFRLDKATPDKLEALA